MRPAGSGDREERSLASDHHSPRTPSLNGVQHPLGMWSRPASRRGYSAAGERWQPVRWPETRGSNYCGLGTGKNQAERAILFP